MCLCDFEQGTSVSAFSQPSQLNQLKVTLPLASVPSKRSWSFSSSRLDDNRARAQNLTTLWLGMDFINYPVQFLNLISMSNCESLICFLQSQWSDSKCSLYLSCDRFSVIYFYISYTLYLYLSVILSATFFIPFKNEIYGLQVNYINLILIIAKLNDSRF